VSRYFLPCLLACNLAWAEAPADATYTVRFAAEFQPQRGIATASISVDQPANLLRVLDLDAPQDRFSHFSGDGTIERQGPRLLWKVPAAGGTLSYEFQVNHRRGQSLDAKMTDDWAILRLDSLFPGARVTSRAGASSRSALALHGPDGWRFESRYGTVRGELAIGADERKFDRPTGWLAAGKLGVRWETIARRKIAVAGPQGQGMRRMDIIAFLHWTLPKLVKVFPDFESRLLIVGAREGMWRGGLSGPGSLYLHSDRPLLSENATSALLHELVHTATAAAGKTREDWIIEGVAEYYSLEILRRSHGISQKRYERALGTLSAWVDRDHGILTSPSSGANTARAVLLFDEIQRALSQRGAGSLDEIIRKLMAADEIDGRQLLGLVEQALGARADFLRTALNADTDKQE
jgi:hypothetical protein